ncbi:hypothetical protein TanjilG_12775 [Lupinus angustifolius]|uniref:LisH domain-containing protein n=1 Tax=Lupinus angustifolius TaxID=3871 RepID=A0A1J7HA88_LUPAN|nr:hypothetical protein TanjilG_12775 [Lupinus angustifolius]
MAEDSGEWDADKMLDFYIHDYLVKNNLHASAQSFMTEANLPVHKPAMKDAPDGFLYEWWSVFWDLSLTKMQKQCSESASAYIEAQIAKAREHRLQMQQLLVMQKDSAQLQQRDSDHSVLGGSLNAMNSKVVMGPPEASVSATEMFEERMKQLNSMGSEASLTPMHTYKMAFPKSATTHYSRLIGDHSRHVSSSPQRIQTPTLWTDDIERELNSGVTPMAMPMEPSVFEQTMLQVNSGLSNAGFYQGNTSVPVMGMPLTNDRKRQHPSCPEAANSTIGWNNVGKSMMMDGTYGTGGVASSSNLMENMEQYEQVGAKGDNIRSLQPDDGGGDDGKDYGTINQTLPKQKEEASKGFTFTEFKCIRMTNSKVTCCDFSSDEKFLASAGHDKKVVLWNMDTLKTESTPEEHKWVISDVRFRPNSTVFVTSCMDNCVRLWDAANPRYCLEQYNVHSSAVMSVDFHPKQTDILCVSDSKNEIQYWNITTSSFINTFKGGNAMVRFQPGVGQVLAAAYDNGVSIFDAETGTYIYSLQGHPEAVSYICWDANGNTLASMSPNLVKIWSLASGECVREYSSTSENQFHSCAFHPRNSTILVIGGNSHLELWNIDKNRTLPILAHKDIISSLVHSSVTGIVASASHDGFVKLWK